MSASKIIIHKSEAGNSRFKSLWMTITSGDNDSEITGTKYSDWLDGKLQEKKKNTDKLSRLVVKIVSGNDIDRFNLDACAKEIDDTKNILTNFTEESKPSYGCLLSHEGPTSGLYIVGGTTEIVTKQYKDVQECRTHSKDLADQYYIDKRSSETGEDLSPLEYSLEKVKENNARIMENIHMLNRTLNYTKKKEFFDILCEKSMRSHHCNTCGKCFVYETGLRKHYSMHHSITEVQQRWQVVWTCIQCFQVWPRQDQALTHARECCNSDNRDWVREIKTSSLLQCEFCEKVYTSIPRLLRHSKIHTTSNNYECNACETTFSSYKIAEEHWVSCHWLKMFYTFSLPKLLLCNACDRKFRNYEQLYNHRYKVGHFMTKTHYDPYIINTLGMLFYQCEMCVAWFSSVPPLIAHRNQYHPKHELQYKVDKNIIDQNMLIDNELCASQTEENNMQEQ